MNGNIDDVDAFSQSFNSVILDTADKITPTSKSPMPKWMSDSTMLAISSKKNVQRSHGDSSTQYKITKTEVKKLVKKDKINKINDDLDGFSDLPSGKQFFPAMKKLKTNRKNISWALKDKNGKLLTSKEDILERWATFYEELYDDQTTCHPIDVSHSEPPIPRIIKREIQAALKKLKSGKSPGIDKVHYEFLKAGGPILINILEKFCNAVERPLKKTTQINYIIDYNFHYSEWKYNGDYFRAIFFKIVTIATIQNSDMLKIEFSGSVNSMLVCVLNQEKFQKYLWSALD